MIIVGTRLKVQDNSGAKSVKCIRVLNKSRTKLATVGDQIVIAVKNLKRSLPNKKVKIGEVALAIILSTKKPINRQTGITLKVERNTVLLLDKEKKVIIGTRVGSGVFNEIRLCGLIKILSIAKGLL